MDTFQWSWPLALQRRRNLRPFETLINCVPSSVPLYWISNLTENLDGTRAGKCSKPSGSRWYSGGRLRVYEDKFFSHDSPLSTEWKERLSQWKELFSKSDYDVGCAKSPQHRIQHSEDNPFRERARRIPLSDLEDLWELAELKRTGVREFWSTVCMPPL